jgi:hypothetical protein
VEIDQAVAWGGDYDIHVCINFHRAPGFTVNTPPETRSLWADEGALDACCRHWGLFARRYRGIPNRRLSFNLFNEPHDITPETHRRIVERVVAAIRREDPERLIIADGRDWGRTPCTELLDLGLAQATRGYDPFQLTHYLAGWVAGAEDLPVPAWPTPLAHGTVYGTIKPDLATPLCIHGPFEERTRIRFRVGVVSTGVRLRIEADGTTIWEKHFVCGPGEGEWESTRYAPEWDIHVSTYNRDYTVTLPAGTGECRIRATEGDWLQVLGIGVLAEGVPESTESVLPLLTDYGSPPDPLFLTVDEQTGRLGLRTERVQGPEWLWTTKVDPWREVEGRGVGVMVGEWGAYNKTPHDVTMAWMRDCLETWKRAGWGWALWNFRGPFGIVDSGREDVEYEDFHGHKLDRAMLELLQEYLDRP